MNKLIGPVEIAGRRPNSQDFARIATEMLDNKQGTSTHQLTWVTKMVRVPNLRMEY